MHTRRYQVLGLSLTTLLALARSAAAQAPAEPAEAPPPPDADAGAAAPPAEPGAAAEPQATEPQQAGGPKIIRKKMPLPTVFTKKGLKDVKPVLTEPPKPPKRTTGMLPTDVDFGAEGDMYSTVNVPPEKAFTKRWNYTIQGFLRAPMRVGLGPRNDGTVGTEMHSPPRVPGANQYEWTNSGLTSGPDTALFITIENVRVSGTVILQANALWDVGFKNVETMGGVSQAYVTMKFPDMFGSTGGLAWTIGGFSNRYGNAGPNQQSSGYYQTQLFGRTHVLGEAFTANLKVGQDMTLLVEHGAGAKLEVLAWTSPTSTPPPPRASWLPEQGPQPQGSTFVHHGHVGLDAGSLSAGAHYLYEWSPNDFFVQTPASPEPETESASLTVVGADVHYDDETFGHGYLGFSHLSADNVLPLAGGLEALHSLTGLDFVNNYFGALGDEYFEQPVNAVPPLAPVDDSGTVNTLLFQYMLPVTRLMGGDEEGPELTLAAFGMYNSIKTDALEQTRLKFGAEAACQFTKNFTAGFRFDRVMPDGSNAEAAHMALSPRLALSSTWINREYVMLSYTRYILGDQAFPSRTFPYDQLTEADPNLIVLTGAVSF